MRRGDVKTYVGIDKDLRGGMTDTGKIIRDAWTFGIIPETETCTGWTIQGIETLWQKVQDAWGQHGYRVGNLPPEIREKFDRIHAEAISRAKSAGWDPEADITEG